MDNESWSFKISDLWTVPNLLTYLRFMLVVPFMCFFLQQNYIGAAVCIGFSVLTDCFDGLLARKLNQVTSLGKILDPIADKIMVAAVILVLTAKGMLSGPYAGDLHVIAGLIILVREIAVWDLREFLGGLQVSVPVSSLAKWKTTLQLVALGALILAGALPAQGWVHQVGLLSLWGAAILTLVTGWDYLRVGLKHMD